MHVQIMLKVANQTKLNRLKLNSTKHFKGFEMSYSAAQLLYGPILVLSQSTYELTSPHTNKPYFIEPNQKLNINEFDMAKSTVHLLYVPVLINNLPTN